MFDAATLHSRTHTKLFTRLAGRTVPWTMRARPARLSLCAVSDVNATEQAMDYKLEVVAVPVRDVDTANAFCERIGYHTDHDHRVNDHLRFVQITPPGSDCSVVIGDGVTSAVPGRPSGCRSSATTSIAARAELRDAGVEVGEIGDSPSPRFVYFSDPDGNGWAVQRFPTAA